MVALHQGAVFPSSSLETPSFLIILTFVAINTLIYLGITVAKLIPRPKARIQKTHSLHS
jgi:hypothetical protein